MTLITVCHSAHLPTFLLLFYWLLLIYGGFSRISPLTAEYSKSVILGLMTATSLVAGKKMKNLKLHPKPTESEYEP